MQGRSLAITNKRSTRKGAFLSLFPFSTSHDVAVAADLYGPPIIYEGCMHVKHGKPSHVFSLINGIINVVSSEVVMMDHISCHIAVGGTCARVFNEVFHEASGCQGAVSHINKEEMIAVVLWMSTDISHELFLVSNKFGQSLSGLKRDDDCFESRGSPLNREIISYIIGFDAVDLSDFLSRHYLTEFRRVLAHGHAVFSHVYRYLTNLEIEFDGIVPPALKQCLMT